ncbi:MAG: HrcA family transcriptional regulator [Deinococcota bacterium]|uniref:Heat-inducible transcription repressor HrcA n=1 Tax=Allomeiothermus silvanus (strain ATCC 700542 / DSM 9946 / NBRC 106475 / NCIMB 13440 / VI-R2) TaxID=526227 RepID=D7BG42_ALLS1|nr:HrcA family transcriptional regulator [Allomeiothermus silvanus]ADH61963.1 heat-inducible transcription repressor HrcA [Allomeiothermus silvanus DSM 9946]
MTSRQRQLLYLLVETYIHTQTPVPSGLMAERMGLSPAMARYELIELEQAGLVTKPHASAGRIPTRQGFQTYALSLLPPNPLPQATQDQLAQVIEGAGARREVLLVQVAARLARYPAVLRIKPRRTPRLLQVHLSLLGAGQVLAVAVLEGGRVREARLEVSFSPSEAQLAEAEGLLKGRFAAEALPTPPNPALRDLFAALSRAFARGGLEEYREGMGLILSEPEAQNPAFVRQAIELFEAPKDDPLTPPGGVNLRVGEGGGFSLVQVGIGMGEVVGELTLLGPVRMRYGEALSVAHTLGRAYMRG